jgi:hypothetical protein
VAGEVSVTITVDGVRYRYEDGVLHYAPKPTVYDPGYDDVYPITPAPPHRPTSIDVIRLVVSVLLLVAFLAWLWLAR